jgi:hypothetical protein
MPFDVLLFVLCPSPLQPLSDGPKKASWRLRHHYSHVGCRKQMMKIKTKTSSGTGGSDIFFHCHPSSFHRSLPREAAQPPPAPPVNSEPEGRKGFFSKLGTFFKSQVDALR